jgi:hypothetical protein
MTYTDSLTYICYKLIYTLILDIINIMFLLVFFVIFNLWITKSLKKQNKIGQLSLKIIS